MEKKAPTSPRQPDRDRFIAIGSLLAAIVFFVLQTNGVEMNWILSVAIYIVIAICGVVSCLRHAVPRSNTWKKILASLAVLTTAAGLGVWGTMKQYRREHASSVPTPEQAPAANDSIGNQAEKSGPYPKEEHHLRAKMSEGTPSHSKTQPQRPPTERPSPVQQVTINSPNGIGIAGSGTVINPTVNNFLPTPRHLDRSLEDSIWNCVSAHPGTAMVFGLSGSTEAANYASEWFQFLHDAGWTMADKVPHPFMEGGTTWGGTHIEMRGTYEGPNHSAMFDESSAGGAFVKCLDGKQVPNPIEVILKPEIPENRINLLVGPQS